MQNRYDTVLFDLDGTLLDTLGDLAGSINYALAAEGFKTRSPEEVRRFLGDGAHKLVTRTLPPGFSPAQEQAVLLRFRAHYAANLHEKTRPYDGITELLETLSRRGVGMGVVSNKFDAAVGPLIAHFFGKWIAVTVGEGNGIPKKPSPEGVLKAMQLLIADAVSTLYVGDSDVDVQTAHNAGLLCVGCTWGFRGREALVAAGADLIIESPKMLLELI